MALRIRRGPTTDRTGVRFLEGELIYDTDLGQVFIGDSTDGLDGTLGGVPVTSFTSEDAVDSVGAALVAGNATNSNITFTYDSLQDIGNRINATVSLDGGLLNIVEDLTPELGGDLNLNTHTIAGVGDIDITGSVSASTGLFGNLTGNVTGNVSGSAATVTDASQTAITQVGTLSSLGVTGTVTANKFSATVGLGATVETSSITTAGGDDLIITPDTIIQGTLSAETTTALNDVNTSGLVTINTIDGSPLTINIDDSAVTSSRANGLLVNLQAAANDFAGPGIEFRVNSVADGEDNLAIISAIQSSEGASIAFKLWDGSGYNYESLYTDLTSTVINESLVIQQNVLFTHSTEDITPIVTLTTQNLTLYPKDNIITYGNILPGLEDDGSEDGVATPIPSGTFDIGSDSARYKNLYLAGVTLTEVPATAAGAEGDVAGMIAFDGSYIYRCSTDWTDGLTDIWGRTAVTYTTWS
jgi:hypothetical protein